MRHFPLLFALLFAACAAPKWHPAAGPLTTPWTARVRPNHPWPEYPRPHLVRPDWKSLNGLWSYAIQPAEAAAPAQWQGNILVPYPVESALSGVQRPVGADQALWYKTAFAVPAGWKGRDLWLHFEAVDWACQVWINGHGAGAHRGGYDPFRFNITPWLKPGQNELLLRVEDPSDEGWQPLGKQTLHPGGIFYTAVTGIWQSVWLEPAPPTHIADYRAVPDIDRSTLTLHAQVEGAQAQDRLVAEAFFNGEKVVSASGPCGEGLSLLIPQARLWAPEGPNLYDLKIKVLRNNQVLDEVSGYFGMRKVSLGKEADGFTKILLNNRFLFQNGPLDQGFWPDGIYTAPNEAAMKFDLEMIQKMGFNMLRKHVKVEPRRFYYWCDQMGLLVWQDMPNGDQKIGPDDPDIQRTPESARQYETELSALIATHINHPSIIMWVPFNEGWGQYETPRIVQYIKKLDPTRLVNNASGWSDRGTGDVLDWHHYPSPVCPPAEPNRAVVLGEFGGLGLKTEGHMWEAKNWGYSSYANPDALLADYEKYYAEIWTDFAKKGLSACIYTQITDVETEANGLMTYDRRVTKADPADLYRINTGHFLPAPQVEPFGGLLNAGDTIRLKAGPGADIRYTLDGSTPTETAQRYTGPVRVAQNTALRTKAFAGGQSSRTVAADFTITATPRPRYLYPYHPKYRAGNDFALVDGHTGSEQYGDGRWQGFSGNDLAIVLDLQAPQTISAVTIGLLEHTDAWIFLPRKVTVYTSSDGVAFEKAGETIFSQPRAIRPPHIERPGIRFAPRQARYVKVQAENLGTCPDWHVGKGQSCWIFADEVQVVGR